jgi:serine phosphatase RsbU (regulator of sigma subunit)/ligand-binding sensor domain-containing protein
MAKISCIILFLITFPCWSQTGNYYISNFSNSDYGGADQNWCSIQDEYGRMFFANNNGVLLNDGKSWKLIKLSNDGRCYSIDKDGKNRIFIGGENEFGYLVTAPGGEIIYQSLSAELPQKNKEFGTVWATLCINDEVFFCSNQKLFWYKNGKIKSFSPESEGFHTFFKVGDHLFVREKQVGFKVFINGELKKVTDSEQFAEQRVDFILPFKNKMFWVGARNKGMFLLLYDAEHPQKSIFSKVRTNVDQWMEKNELYCGARVNGNTYALGSLKGGILLADKNFKTFKTITDKEGLKDNGVTNIYVDKNENLWLSLGLGISYLEFSNPITRWTKNDGIVGEIESAIKCNGLIYIATDKGLQVLNPVNNKFTETGISGDRCFALYAKNKSLLIGSQDGLFSLINGESRILYEPTVYCILPDPLNPETLYLGTDKGLSIVSYRDNVVKELKSFNDWGEIRFAANDKAGILGFATDKNGIYLLNRNANDHITHITVKEGLPNLVDNTIFSYKGEFMIGTEKGFYRIENSTSGSPLMVKMNELNPLSIQDLPITKAKQINNDLWFHYIAPNENKMSSDVLRSIEINNKSVTERNFMLHRIKGVDAKDFYRDSNRVYISTNNGLYCYDRNVSSKQSSFYTFISKLNFKKDTSSVFNDLTVNSKFPEVEIPFLSNDIHVVPSASDYYDVNELNFAYYLEGKEDDYGNWRKISEITYNNLHEGKYILHVKSRNVLGLEGKEISFSFTILPPWYRTIWAYILYGVFLVTLLWTVIRLNSRRLLEQNIKLEKVITERTKTIAHQKEEIEYKNREITDSINYAKRIQDAILPSIREIKKVWSDTFVFFQPKDIVSGDFYWHYKINPHEFLIAVADCTGHGVPGGFMSMICSDKLSEAAGISTAPAEVLHYANNTIKLALKQSEEEENVTKDGMEMALVHVNTQTCQVWFSGANRPLWIVRKDSNELEEIKPTKASVASNTPNNFHYQSHGFQMAKGDRLYMSSDGYPDQFGGPNGKKYMTANFKKFLLSIKDEAISRQHDLVKDNINNWMKGFEQVDDLLVIGIRL